ncbi:hypothetical protein [Fuchsiella alkaliacetigena]|uniref:hypothetical protein n=1 Tax=Fuchsiella alkaliacetigena TaxID=957042 RepID=UPI00200A0C6F|nr:hypothetical protein [Fuchsiella alkaliacetigena]MCK8825507.1 hypothetical protein [Fuchsiella alkaliacetigena]
MEWKKVENSIFSLRDILSYLLPGLISILSMELFFDLQSQKLIQRLPDDSFIIIIIYFFLAYFLGILCNIIARKFLFTSVCIFKDPFEDILNSNSKSFSDVFIKKLKYKMKDILGENIIKQENDKNIIYLCWRYIQNFGHNLGFSYLFRLVTLFDMCASLFIANFFLSLALFFTGEFFLGLIGSATTIFLYKQGYYEYRKEFGENILRIFYTISEKE